MITMNQMYWLTRLDHLSDVLTTAAVILVLVAAGTLIAGSIMQDRCFADETNERGRKFVGRTPFMAAAFVVTLLLNALIPTTKEMAAIIVIPSVLNNEKVQTVGNKLYDLAVEWMDELRPSKDKEKKGDRQ